MSSSSRSRASISKQRGAEMSSRLIPPKTGAIALTVRDDLVGVLRVQADRPGVDPAELLEQDRLALHHGQRRLRADVAEAEHRGAVGDDGDRVLLDGQVPDLLGVVGDRAADARDAGRVGHREVVARLQRGLRARPRACRRGAAGTCGRRRARPRSRRAARTASTIACDVRVVGGEHVTSRTFLPCSTRTRSIAPSRPPASPIAPASRAKAPGLVVQVHAQGRAEGGGRMRALRRSRLSSLGSTGRCRHPRAAEGCCGFSAAVFGAHPMVRERLARRRSAMQMSSTPEIEIPRPDPGARRRSSGSPPRKSSRTAVTPRRSSSRRSTGSRTRPTGSSSASPR